MAVRRAVAPATLQCEAIIEVCNAYGNRGAGYEQDDALDRLILDLSVLPRSDEQQIASRAGCVNECRDRITDRSVRIMMQLAKECPNELMASRYPPRCAASKTNARRGNSSGSFGTSKKRYGSTPSPERRDF